MGVWCSGLGLRVEGMQILGGFGFGFGWVWALGLFGWLSRGLGKDLGFGASTDLGVRWHGAFCLFFPEALTLSSL